ncbi:MAG: tRNA (N6-threonylcarbamoyladenosine(37)-N6)-methyltransferase TrmO [Candidatus Bathyarchaeia archaeon]
MGEIKLIPIGVVHTSFSDEEVKDSPYGVEGILEVFEVFSAGLEGIEGFSHLIVVAFLDRVGDDQRRVLRVKFRRLLKFGLTIEDLPEVGVFCSDSPHRPNPLALTVVELTDRKGCLLYVRNLDLFDGTPILDLKPYTPDRRVEKLKLPEWYRKLMDRVSLASGLREPRL